MKRIRKKIIALLILCASVLCFSSCKADVRDATYKDNGDYEIITVKDGDTEREYISCGRGIYAVTVGEIFAEDGDGNEYATIKFEDSSRFICDNDTDLPYVYRASDVEEITAFNFNPLAAALYLEGDSSSLFVDFFYAEPKYQKTTGDVSEGLIAEDDSEYTYAIRDTLQEKTPVKTTAPSIDDVEQDYTVHIRLLSADYPGLYYEVVFWRDLDGINYLYDMTTGCSYYCPVKVTQRLWEDQ